MEGRPTADVNVGCPIRDDPGLPQASVLGVGKAGPGARACHLTVPRCSPGAHLSAQGRGLQSAAG